MSHKYHHPIRSRLGWRVYLEIRAERVPVGDRRGNGSVTWHSRGSQKILWYSGLPKMLRNPFRPPSSELLVEGGANVVADFPQFAQPDQRPPAQRVAAPTDPSCGRSSAQVPGEAARRLRSTPGRKYPIACQSCPRRSAHPVLSSLRILPAYQLVRGVLDPFLCRPKWPKRFRRKQQHRALRFV